MADPITAFGASAAASALAQQAVQLIKFFIDLYGKIKAAPELIQTRILHISQLNDLSTLIRDTPPLQTKQVDDALIACQKTTSRLLGVLQKQSLEDVSKWKRRMRVVKAAIKDDEIVEMLERIEGDKTFLMLCVHQIDAAQLHSLNLKVSKALDSLGSLSVVVDDTARNVKTVVNIVPEMAAQVEGLFNDVPKRLAAIEERLDALILSPVPDLRAQAHYYVPKRRVRNFIGREDILVRIDRAFQSTQVNGPQVVVLRAMGGQGKTQIALEYCYRMRNAPLWGIFWVDASSENTLKQDLALIAELLKPATDVWETTDIKVNSLLRVLEDQSQPWLLILDNYDDPSAFENITDYMTDNECGRIIITSRNADADMLAENDNQIHLPGLPESEAQELLLNQSQCTVLSLDDRVSKYAKEIVERLGCHALAIAQAGAYIAKRKIPLEEFLEHFERRKTIILKNTPQMSQYRRKLGESEKETSLSVFTTWELSFRQLEETDFNGGQMGRFLTLLAFFDSKDISETIFKAYCEFDPSSNIAPVPDRLPVINENNSSESLVLGVEDSGPESDQRDTRIAIKEAIKLSSDPHVNSDAVCFENSTRKLNRPNQNQRLGLFSAFQRGTWNGDSFCDTLATLNQLSLVSTFDKGENGVYHVSLHPLVKDWIRLRTEVGACQEYSSLAAICIFRLLKMTPDEPQYILSLSARQELLAHFKILEDNRREFFLQSPFPSITAPGSDPGELEFVFGRFEYESGRYQIAEEWGRASLKKRLTEWGLENQNTLNSMSLLALCLNEQGKYKEAEELSLQTLEQSEKILGPDHAYTMALVVDLVSILEGQGKFNEAKELGQRSLELHMKVLGPEHQSTLRVLNNLASTMESLGYYEESERMHRQELKGCQKLMGPQHLETLISMSNLALSLVKLERLEEAESLQREELDLCQKTLGMEHPHTLLSTANYAGVLSRLGRLEDAEVLLRQTLLLQNTILGPENHFSLMTMLGLGQALSDQKRYNDAENIYRRMIMLREKWYPEDHPTRFVSTHALAALLCHMQRFNEALPLYDQAITGAQKVLGSTHPETLKWMKERLELLEEMGGQLQPDTTDGKEGYAFGNAHGQRLSI